MRLPRMANRWRITVWIVLSVLVVSFAVGLVAVSKVRSSFTAQMDEELRVHVKGLQSALAILSPEQIDQIAKDQSDIATGDATFGLVFSSPDGTVVAIPSRRGDRPDPPIDTGPRALGELRAQAGAPFDLPSADGSANYRAIVRQTGDGGLIVVTRPLAVRDEAVRVVVRVLAVAGLATAVLISVTVAIVSAVVTRPLDAMIDTAEAIGEGDLTSRIPTTGVEDVSRLAVALNRMLDRLELAFTGKEASEDALRRFVSDASHELRTPLSAVIGYADLHRSGMAGPDQADASLERIRVEGERMRVIVEELLVLARLDEQGHHPVEPTDVGEVVEAAVAAARAIEPDRPITFDAPPSPLVIAGDAHSLRRAVDNLLTNARMHTERGTPVAVAVRGDAGAVQVSVADEGPGLSADDAAHIFERFYRTDRSRARQPGAGPGGSGLGLAIVAAVAAAHGGEATVETTLGGGSTFTVSLARSDHHQ